MKGVLNIRASCGQYFTQAQQSVQAAASVTIRLSDSDMARVGQTSIQVPHKLQSSLLSGAIGGFERGSF